MTSSNSLWVVEVDFNDGKGFVPTAGTALTREDARVEKIVGWDHQFASPKKSVRIRKYQRVD